MKEFMKAAAKLLIGTIGVTAGTILIKKGLENANQIGGLKR